jgi:DNA-binding transcriptional regulator YiaG
MTSEQVMKKLKNGWVEGSAQDFLELSDADVEFIEMRRTLSQMLKELRLKLHLTQVQLAARLETSQSRVAKMEKADPTVSADLLLQSLFQLGVRRKELAKAI